MSESYLILDLFDVANLIWMKMGLIWVNH